MSEGFWLTEQGIDIRLQDLSQLIVTKTYNRALQAYAGETGIKNFAYMTMRDSNVCPICAPNDGKVYRTGQFMPVLPRHIGCRCYWDIFFDMPEVVSYG